MRQPECPIFRMAFDELQECRFILQDDRVMMNNGKELTAEGPEECVILVRELAAVVQIEEEFTFGELLERMHTARGSKRKKLETVIQLLTTTFFEQEERLYPQHDAARMISWATSVTTLGGFYDISDAFGIWASHCSLMEPAPA